MNEKESEGENGCEKGIWLVVGNDDQWQERGVRVCEGRCLITVAQACLFSQCIIVLLLLRHVAVLH